jgi:small subunit ribosomal protein S9
MEDLKEANKGTEELDKVLGSFGQQEAAVQPQQKKQRKAASKPKKKAKAVKLAKGKRKEAVARASITDGNGSITINGIDVNLIKPMELREFIIEPLEISEDAAGIAKGSSIRINVSGGGVSGRAQASRNALAKAIIAAASPIQGEKIKRLYMDYDRNILVDDHRRVEPKKFLGPKARSRFQTSYR